MSARTPTTTQQRYPWRAALRTWIQNIVPTLVLGGVIVPEIVTIILEEAGARVEIPGWARGALLGTAAAAAAVGAVFTRIMAIPRIDELAGRLGLGSDPRVGRHRP